MPTAAKTTFDVNIRRAGYFLDIHQTAHGRVGAPLLQIRELPRGAVVFAVGALDAYLSEVSGEVIVAQVQRRVATADEKETLKRVQTEVPTIALEIAILGTQTERLQRLQASITEHFMNHVSNHGAKAVASTFARVGGRAQDLWTTLTGDGFPNAADTIDSWTDIRHRIVHQGQSPRVLLNGARDFIDLLVRLVGRVDARAEAAMAA